MNAKTRAYLRFCGGLLRYKPLITFVNVACNAVIFTYGAALAYCVRQILNSLEDGLRGGVLQQVAPYLILILVASLVRVMAIMGCASLDSLRAYYYQNRTRANVMRLLYRRDDMTQVAGNSGRLFEVADDDIPVCTFPPELLTEVTGHAVYTMIALAMLIYINWKVTLFIFIPLSMAVYGIQKLSERMKERRKENREAHDDVSNFIADVANSVLAVKTSGSEEGVLGQFRERNRRRTQAVLEDVLFNAKIQALLMSSVSVGTVVMMFIAARMIAGDTFRIGDFSIFVSCLGTLADCVNRIVELISEGKRAEVSYERILETVGEENAARLLDDADITLKRSKEIPQAHMKPRIPLQTFEAKHISFSYDGNNGFRDVSLEVYPGELIAIAGGVGSGKSTLLGVLSGSMKADTGALLWNEEEISDCPTFCIPPNVAYSPQRAGFFSSDIRANLCLGHSATREELDRAVSVAALEGTIAAMKEGFDTFVGNRGDMLSGGQRQRLALARMLVRDAELNIIDDCVSALDEQTQLEFSRRLIHHLDSTGHAAVMATNMKTFLMAADNIIVMKEGGIIARGHYDDLAARCEEFVAMVS